MTALTLGEATTMALATFRPGRAARPVRRGGLHRTGAAVRRDSIEAGTFEGMFFAVPAKGEPDRMLRAARAALDAGRRLKRAARVEERELSSPERALAALTAGAVRVFEEICTLARLNGGRVYPSYDRLAQATALGRATIARALIVLEAAGFLVRQRRFKRIEAQGAGPRYAQTSNVYRPALPAKMMTLLPRWIRPAPPPADAVQRMADRAEEVAAMEAGLSARERTAGHATGALARMLARLGAAVDAAERESHNNPQPLPHTYISTSDRADLDGQHTNPDGSAE
jgi:hypothetical protein